MGLSQSRRYEKRQKLIDSKGGSCVLCGSRNNLDLHHRDPRQKSFSLNASNMDRRWADLEAEAAKCDLVCQDCHRHRQPGDDKISSISTILQNYSDMVSAAKRVELRLKLASLQGQRREDSAQEALRQIGFSEHGSPETYSHGCRCTSCIRAVVTSFPQIEEAADKQDRLYREIILVQNQLLDLEESYDKAEIDQALYESDRARLERLWPAPQESARK